MNIIIPLAGNGQRFKDDGYKMPKPLIMVIGEPLIFHVIRCLKLEDGDTLYIVYSEELDNFMFRDIVRREFPYVRFIPLSYQTRGAVETVLCGLNHVADISQPTLVVDGDTFYDIYSLLYHARATKENGIFYFTDTQKDPIYSYISLNGNTVTNIKEKVKISDNACTGAYLFRDGALLKRTAEVMLSKEEKQHGEYYMSGVYQLLLAGGETVLAHQAMFECLGTPNQLKAYCMKAAPLTSRGQDYRGLEPKIQALYRAGKRRFCFDLDNTLCTYPQVPGDYSTVQAIPAAVARLKYLHSLGHTIIIQTARGMKSSGHNQGMAVAKAHRAVHEFLNEHQIPFDELHFGKPQADFYIDDLAVSTTEDIDKAIGFYDGKVEPRAFNRIEDGQFGEIRKTTNNPGEIYWYQNIPDSIEEHFPVGHIHGNTIQMERINGVPLNYLFINGSLQVADIDLLFGTMHKIHCSRGSQSIVGHEVLYDNYWLKVFERYEANRELYALCAGYTHGRPLLEKLQEGLKGYEINNKAMAGVIHGDMVFSNIFLCEPRHLKFIDMRGRVGDKNTIYGDIFYDYAKVYQSLCGYDYVLMGKENAMGAYNEWLLHYFEMKFIALWGKERMGWLRALTASLFFSLIPLHTDIAKQKRYFKMAESLL